jgi:hypothetical protein
VEKGEEFADEMRLVEFFKSKVLLSPCAAGCLLLHALKDLESSYCILAILLIPSVQIKLESYSFVQ